MQNSMVYTEDNNLYWFRPSWLSNSLYIQSVGHLLCIVWLSWSSTRGAACLTLYRSEDRTIILVIVGYNWRVLILL
jgi:hypothetical protein